MSRKHAFRQTLIFMVRAGRSVCPLILLLAGFSLPLHAQNERRLTDSVNIYTLARHVQTLAAAGGHPSRVKFTPGGDSAAAYIKREFDALGLASVVVDTFTLPAKAPFNTTPLFNVVATLPGTVNPESLFVIGAHYDCSASRMGSWSTSWQSIAAPGADDNATGVAVMLEAARILANPVGGFRPRHTIVFAGYGSEESNPADSAALSHGGSRFHAAKLQASGAGISGMVSVDMVGYNKSWLFTSIITNPASRWLADIFHQSIARNAIGIYDSIAQNASATYSDHDRFWAAGYPAVCLMEYAPPWVNGTYYRASPLYHTSSDSFGSVKMDLVRRVAQMTVASVARVAGDILTGIEASAFASGSPQGPVLFQNYPNPFNPETAVGYHLPAAGNAKLTVFDLLGREVATLASGPHAGGSHTVRFNASGLPSGVYYYRLEAGANASTRSMILLR
jgi:hypothetical protein